MDADDVYCTGKVIGTEDKLSRGVPRSNPILHDIIGLDRIDLKEHHPQNVPWAERMGSEYEATLRPMWQSGISKIPVTWTHDGVNAWR